MKKRKKALTIDDLALMIQSGFEEAATKLEIQTLTTRLDRFEKYIEGRFDTLEGEVVRIREEVKLLRKDLGNNEIDLHDLHSRVERLEKKLGLAK
jgi:predicted  nucleic acid-binding Zn-ribbon protein